MRTAARSPAARHGVVLALALFVVAALSSVAAAEPKPQGLYRSWKGVYWYFWPDGKYVKHKPRWRKDGSFDYGASIEGLKPYLHGTYKVEGSGDKRTIVINDSAGGSARIPIHLTKNGRWRMGSDKGDQLPASSDPPAPGAYKATSSSSSSGAESNMRAGDVHVGFEFGRDDVMIIEPGQRFSLASKTSFITSKTHGTGSGNLSGSAKQSGSRSSGAGKLKVKGQFLVLTFDDGRVVEDLYHMTPSEQAAPRFVLGNRLFRLQD